MLPEKKSRKKLNLIVDEDVAEAFKRVAAGIDDARHRSRGAKSALLGELFDMVRVMGLEDIMTIAEAADDRREKFGSYMASLGKREAARIRKRTRS